MAVTTINIDSQVLTFANLAAFPVTGTVKTIYIAEDTNFQYYWDGSQYVLLTTDINIPANLIFYATTAPSSVSGYERLVISPDDVDYDNPAVNVPTGAITTTGQLVGEQVADADIFAGNPGILNISTIGEIRRTSGTGTARFYFEIYQRTSLGVETLRGTSNLTLPISGGVYQQFQVDCLFNNGTWLTTDRVVIKYYADRVAGGSNPNYDFLFGGANPVRTLFPISAQLLLNVPIAIGITGVTGGILDEVLLTDGSGKLGQSELKTVGGNSLFGSGDIPVGGGITIGTTAIASGTVGRVLFEGAGNVVQQSSNFFWDNTNGRLGIRVATPTASLEVLGAGTTTGQSFAVHNSTGNNNALVVRDNTRVGIGTSTLNTTFNLFSQETSRTSAIFDTNQNASGNANAISFRLNNTPTSRINQVTTANREGIHISWDNNLGTGVERGMYIGRDGVQINGISLNENAVGTIWTRLSGILNSSYSQINVGVLTAIYRDANTVGFGVGNEFHLLNSSNNRVIYGGVGCAITTNTAGSHAGALTFSNAVAGTSAERMRISPTGGLLIGTTTDTPSSILNLTSTTKGFLLPRMTTAQRDLIATPAEGLVIYNTTTQVLNFYNGAVWAAV